MNALLDFIQRTAMSSTTSTHCVMPAAIKATASVLLSTGGRMIVVQGGMSVGEGTMNVKESLKMYGTTEEMSL